MLQPSLLEEDITEKLPLYQAWGLLHAWGVNAPTLAAPRAGAWAAWTRSACCASTTRTAAAT
jgi:hypothetical protein